MSMRHRGIAVCLLLVAAACDNGSAATTTTTTVPVATTTSTTTTSTTTTTLIQNRDPIARNGDRNSIVEALQFLMDCNGFGPLTIDGIFGSGTQSAVEQVQISLGRETTGAPDEETLALLARDCSESRRIEVEDGEGVAAGNVAASDPDTFFVRSGESGRLSAVLVAEGGGVVLDMRRADGTSVGGGSAAVATAPEADEDYVLQVTATGEVAVTYRVFVSTGSFDALEIAAAAEGAVVLDEFEEVVTDVCVDTTGRLSFVAETASGYLVVAADGPGTFATERGGVGAAVEFVFRDGSPGYHGHVADVTFDVGTRVVGAGPVFVAESGRLDEPVPLAFDFGRSAAPCGGGAATSLMLGADGLGVVGFGAASEDAIALVRQALPDSSPIVDTGWVPLEGGGAELGVCREGTSEIRVVEIDNVTLYFTDAVTTWQPAGGRHFTGYRVAEGVFPVFTREGVGPGSTLGEVLAAHPDAVAGTGLQGGIDAFISSPPGNDAWLRAVSPAASGPGDTGATVTEVIGGRFCDG